MDGRKVAGVAMVGTSLAAGLLVALLSCSGGGEGRTPIQIAIDNERERKRLAAVAARKAAEAQAQAVNQSRTPSRRGQPIPNAAAGQMSPGDHPEGGDAANVVQPPEGG